MIRLGHSPDPDDAFMFWGLSTGAVDARGFAFEHVMRDIQTLNEWALEGRLEATAISMHAYPFVQDQYVILPHGASMGSGSGPIVVGREPMSIERLRRTVIAVPGQMTTAFLVLRLFLGGEFRFREMAYDQIAAEVAAGRADAGLIIGETLLTYQDEGLQAVADLGEWWLLETGLPLPLGINVARRDLGSEPLHDLSDVVGESIAAGLDNRNKAFAHAVEEGRAVNEHVAERFVGLYVNERTQDYGDEGREAVRELLLRGERAGAFEPVRVEFV